MKPGELKTETKLFSDEVTLKEFLYVKETLEQPPSKKLDEKYIIRSLRHQPKQIIWRVGYVQIFLIFAVVPGFTKTPG